MPAQVGGQGLARALRQQSLSQQHDDRDRSCEKWEANEGELEETESCQARIFQGFRNQHVLRRAGQQDIGTCVGGEGDGMSNCDGDR